MDLAIVREVVDLLDVRAAPLHLHLGIGREEVAIRRAGVAIRHEGVAILEMYLAIIEEVLAIIEEVLAIIDGLPTVQCDMWEDVAFSVFALKRSKIARR